MQPTINILIRTCKRPKYFADCLASINSQTYKNINIIVGCEVGDNQTIAYLLNHTQPNLKIIYYPKQHEVLPLPANASPFEYGRWFPFNHYLDELGKHVKNGFVMYLDDDDTLLENTAIGKIVAEIKTDELIFWRVKFPDIIIPEFRYWHMLKAGFSPTACHVSGIGFCFHSQYLKDIEWGYWSVGDYRVAAKLFNLCKNKKFIDQTLTGLQDVPHGGEIIDKI